ncbi:MAG: hypothetical protein ACRC9H_09940 [Aeromonas veronii]
MTQRVVNYTYGTGNPVLPDGSIDVRDGIDNLQSLDVFMNAPEDTYNQRDGSVVRTVAGMNNEFDAQILNMGFTRIGTFASGATITNPRQTLLWDIADGGDGQEYGWSGAFPKVVPATSTPASTGGISAGAWMSRFDPELTVQVQEAIRRTYAQSGFNVVGSFDSGGTVNGVNDALILKSSGVAYVFTGSTPHFVPPGSSPDSSWMAVNYDARSYSKYIEVGSIVPVDGDGEDVFVIYQGVAYHCELYAYGGSHTGLKITNITESSTGFLLCHTSIGRFPALAYGKTTQEKFGLVGDISGVDSSDALQLAIYYQHDNGSTDLHFSKKAKLWITATMLAVDNLIIHGDDLEIISGNPQNYYLTCSSKHVAPTNLSRIGDLSFFKAAVEAHKAGGRRPVVVFVGDSLFMGGQNKTDYIWPAKLIEMEILKAVPDAWVFNRAIAGSVSAEVFGNIPSYVVNPSEVKAPGESPWITDVNRTWFSYIEELDPDLVVVGFGMNEYGSQLAGINELYNAITGLSSSIAFVSSPMRTTNSEADLSLGTWPNNDFSNAFGKITRSFCAKKNVTLIDSNKLSNHVMNGINVDRVRFKALANSSLVLKNGSRSDNSFTLNVGGRVETPQVTDGCAFTLTPTRIDGTVYISIGAEVDGVPGVGVSLEMTSSSIALRVPNSTGTIATEIGRWDSTLNRKVRFQFDGEFVQLMVDDIYLMRPTLIVGARALNVAAIAVTATAVINEVLVQVAEFEPTKKQLTTYQIFSGSYGDGGNGMNHFTQIGSRAIYQPAIAEFGSKLSAYLSN